jgi:hypothetical protein
MRPVNVDILNEDRRGRRPVKKYYVVVGSKFGGAAAVWLEG